MEKIKVNLSDLSKAKAFVRVVSEFSSDVDIITNTATCDAKSILGVVAMDLKQDTYARIISDSSEECALFTKAMEDFVG